MIVAIKVGSASLNTEWLEDTHIKYVRVNSLTQESFANQDVRKLVEKMLQLHMPHHNHDNLLLDIKIANFNAGDYGCFNTDWHYDCVKEFEHPSSHEHHTIFTNYCGTEWLQDDGAIVKAGDSEIWSYGRELHRCPQLNKAGKRVVIRLTSTNLIKGVSMK